MKAGYFISLEGGEGCGKSTQAGLLCRALEQAGIAVLRTREPGGEEGAEEIRKLLVEGEPGRWEPLTETLLFMAARVQHVKRRILPALAAGQWVVSDRFHDSTRIYQGIKGVSEHYYATLHALNLGNIQPDLTFLLDIDAQAGLKRTESRGGGENRFERMDRAFHEAVNRGFRELAAREPERWAVMDAEKSPEEVHAAMLAVITERCGLALDVVSVT